MKNLETGKDKIQKICDAIRKETLEPVQQESREIIENAHMQAADIIRDAEKAAEEVRKDSEKQVEEKLKGLKSSLALACRQGIEELKQKIEHELLSKELSQVISKELVRPDVIAKLIESFMRSLENQGIEEDFEVIIPKDIPPRAINSLLAQNILERLTNNTVQVGDFGAGVQLKMKDRQITIDIKDKVVRELIESYIRSDFRDLVFQ